MILLTAVVAGTSAQDDRYWDVGYVAGEQEALRQARRISSAVVGEVWLMPSESDGQGFRLLIRDEEDQARLRTQLRELGITSPRRFEFEGDTRNLKSVFSVVGEMRPAQIAEAPEAIQDISGVSGYFVILGSHHDKAMARARQDELAAIFGKVTVLEATVDEKQYYRVAIGPASGPALDELERRVADAGIDDKWLLPHTGSDLQPRPAVRTESRQPQDVRPDSAETGYNPAKLRREPFFKNL